MHGEPCGPMAMVFAIGVIQTGVIAVGRAMKLDVENAG